jgi:peptide/nickel transport system permease protein
MTAQAGAAPPWSRLWEQVSRTALASPSARMVARRLLAAIPVLWGVTFVTFMVMNLLPGDAARLVLGANATPAEIRAFNIQNHLNEPFWARYGRWLGGAVQGHFGTSLVSQQPVSTVLGQRLPVSFELILYAFVISVAFAVPVALLAARRPNGLADRLTMVISMAGLSTAPYVLALVLVFIFAVSLGVLPALGYVPLSQSVPGNIKSLTLPAISIGFPLFCFYTRLLRADIIEQMQGEDYVVTARAKGVGPWRILVRHALRNSLFGLLTVIGLNLGTLIGAVVIVEQIFSLPGVGQELLQSIGDHDVVVVQAIVLVFAVIVVLANLFTDLLYAVLDPRIRYGRADS